MKLKIRQDGLFDIQLNGYHQKSLNKPMVIKIFKERGIKPEEMMLAMLHKNLGDNVLHFGINRTFMFSTFEPENN